MTSTQRPTLPAEMAGYDGEDEAISATVERLTEIVADTPAEQLPDLAVALAGLAPLPAELAAPLSIASAAELLTLSPHTMRYYERIGLVDVARDAGGHRVYDIDALARLVFISRLRLSGMPIRRIVEYVELVKAGADTVPERLRLLTEHRATLQRQLREMQFSLAVLDYKIATYGGNVGC